MIDELNGTDNRVLAALESMVYALCDISYYLREINANLRIINDCCECGEELEPEQKHTCEAH